MTKSKRLCRKCGDAIPNWTKINGISKSLQNRKFCLTCSPHKLHNTSSTEPDAKRRKIYKNTPEHRRKYSRKYVLDLYRRGLERKTNLIQSAGGCCKICGYNKCRSALSFHHRNPDEKLFGMSLNQLWSKKLAAVEAEAAKCDLLCLNCHMELERQTESEIVKAVNAKYGTNY